MTVYHGFLISMERMISEKYEISTSIRHMGERGRQREDGVAEFLRDNLPERYGVGTGEIFSTLDGTVSSQCDIIIYDKLHTPVIGKRATVQQVPIEAVYAVIEVKSSLNTTALKDWSHKIDTVRSMRRIESSTPVPERKKRGPSFLLFGYHLKTVAENCCKAVHEEYLKGYRSCEYMITLLDTGNTIVIGERPEVIDRVVFLITTRELEDRRWLNATLAGFYVSLLQYLQATDLGEIDFFELIRPFEIRART